MKENNQNATSESPPIKQILIGVTVSVIVALITFCSGEVWAWWKKPTEGKVRKEVTAVLNKYEKGINGHNFDAHSIFCARTERYILMTYYPAKN